MSGRILKPPFERFCDFYETKGAIWIARRLQPYTALMAAYLRFRRIVLVSNIGEAAGHIIVDVDFFCHLKFSGALDEGKRYWWLHRPRDDSNAIAALYSHVFDYCGVGYIVYYLFLPNILMRRGEFLDVGSSRLKHHLPEVLGADAEPIDEPPFRSQISKAEGYRQWLAYYDLKRRNGVAHPFQEGPNWPLPKSLTVLRSRPDAPLALIHIRLRNGINATARRTDAETYVPTLEFLRDEGFEMLLVGREDLPDSFRKLGVIDYPKSRLTCYENDLRLFSNAAFAVTAGSGIALLADIWEVPLVYTNYWHLSMCLFSKNCILLPSLVDDPTGHPLTFTEQIDLYMNRLDFGPEVFPDGYTVRNATADEILSASQEALALAMAPTPRTPRQQAFADVHRDGLMGLSRARVGKYFVDRHVDRFGDRSRADHDCAAGVAGTGS